MFKFILFTIWLNNVQVINILLFFTIIILISIYVNFNCLFYFNLFSRICSISSLSYFSLWLKRPLRKLQKSMYVCMYFNWRLDKYRFSFKFRIHDNLKHVSYNCIQNGIILVSSFPYQWSFSVEISEIIPKYHRNDIFED